MTKINLYTSGEMAQIDQLPLQRDWMDGTFARHAYHCFPVSLSNRLGWGVSFPEDISFVWDGINDSRPDHVTILKGQKYAYSGRGNRTISFYTDLTFVGEDNKNHSILTMPVPNQFIRGAQCMTTIISTSVLQGDLPIAWMITEPNIEITIPANTPIAAVLPISLDDIQNYELEIRNDRPAYETADWKKRNQERGEAAQVKNKVGEWTHFYRDAVDHLGNSLGKHEAKKIVMKANKKK